MFKNRVTGTYPILFHAPGGKDRYRHHLWYEIQQYASSLAIRSCSSIEVLLCDSRGNGGALLNQLKKNQQHHTVLGIGIRNWAHSLKNQLYLDHLKQTKFRYIVALDAYDTCYLGELDESLDLLKSHGMVCGAESYFWCGWNNKSADDYRKAEDIMSGNRNLYLNAGMWVAEREFAIHVMETIISNQRVMDLRNYQNEQPMYHWLLQQEPRMTCDWDQRIFCNDLNDGVLISSVGSKPYLYPNSQQARRETRLQVTGGRRKR